MNKTAEELEEQNERSNNKRIPVIPPLLDVCCRDNELENKLEHARNIAEEAEIEEVSL